MTPKLLIHLQICLLLAASLKVVAAKAPNMTKPGCQDTCGKVSIPYPFGIGPNCFLDPWFEIECRPSPTNSSKPFLPKLFNLELIEIATFKAAPFQSLTVMMPPLEVCTADAQIHRRSSFDLAESPYNFSADDNVFMMKGCQGSALLVNEDNLIMAGCATVCENNSVMPPNSCYGDHCSQTVLSYFLPFQFYQIDFNFHAPGEAQNCLSATLIKSTASVRYIRNQSSSDPTVPVELSWRWISDLVPENNRHATCSVTTDESFSCGCDLNYDGNPYIGCQAPKGCESCRGNCLNHIEGGRYYCENKPLLNLAAIVGLSSSFGMLLLVACIYGLYRFIKRRMEMKRRAKFFKRNGGRLLQQQLLSNQGIVERMKVFTIAELDKATNHFNENRILGQGGQGTVYKGMLPDGSIVAIKKSKLLDASQLEQFINEVVILSRINHRHVVHLFGCCLETEVPLLVYEFISNGTLFKHIHDPDEDFSISWKMRLKIAADSAGAVAYLHSSSSFPIFHRDIKSSNILLDERHRAKVSDFGSSKTIAIDQTHMTTLVQGTMGYLDPEYFQSYQFTEKSDVYSFGVVLLELLTSKKPIYRDAGTMEQKNLVTEFLFMTQSSRLSEFLDPKIVIEAKEDELTSAVELAKRCICWSGKLRPTMKEVVMTLEMIMKSPAQVSTWYQQQEAFPIQYAAYDEFDMSDLSGAEFMSITLPAGASSPPYTDENPLLSGAI